VSNKQGAGPSAEESDWLANAVQMSSELKDFADEFGSFTPELFAEMKIHLLRGSLTKPARDTFCEISINGGQCPRCDLLYETKKCLLWYRLYRVIDWAAVERGPPCIRLAFAKKTIRTVANYLTYVSLVDLPFYQKRMPPSCNMMERWGYCNPNEYCRAMKTGNPIEYMSARERVKMSRGLPK
jgi:hypothetical protein